MFNHLKLKRVALFGAGKMSESYFHALQAINADVVAVVGRGVESAARFKDATGEEVLTGGFDGWQASGKTDIDAAIVSVTVDALAELTAKLIDAGVKYILLEKPGALTKEGIQALAVKAKEAQAEVYLAYNRRFYASVQKAKELIAKDGGVSSFHFEFTEWSSVVNEVMKSELIKKYWLIGNSSHVIDLAFYLGGTPKEITTQVSGGLDWHPSSSRFAGCGRTDAGAFFTYHADWDAPGRWAAEFLTSEHRFIFKPLEKLQVQKKGSVAVEDVDIDDLLDHDFKPGIYKQTRSFLQKNFTDLKPLEQQAEDFNLYYQMADYKEV